MEFYERSHPVPDTILETIAETTQDILENWTFCYQLYTVQITDNQTIEQYNFWQYNTT